VVGLERDVVSAGDGEGALFVVPTAAQGQGGPLAVWVIAAGWAAAARRRYGDAWLLTPQGALSPDEARELAARPAPARKGSRGFRRYVPPLARTAVSDVRQVAKERRFRRNAFDGPWSSRRLGFIWQRHELFHRAGFEVARRTGAPLILFIDAPLVWEHKQWGIRRPGWGRLMELAGERPQFQAADLLLCVSDEVAEEVQRRGGPEERILISPNAVDTEVFGPHSSGQPVRDRHGLDGRFVVGWTGSFRPFHRVETALQAVAMLQEEIPELTLLLVGDGIERPRLQELGERLGLRNVVFTGTVPNAEMPSYIRAMDVALVLHPGGERFYQSPTKLREYFASETAVVAPRLGEMGRLLTDGEEALLIDGDDPGTLAQAIRRLHGDRELRHRLGAGGREKTIAEDSYDRRVEAALTALDRLPARTPVAAGP
jgi:glycosyltransferase involved in cell wall biosynthesis